MQKILKNCIKCLKCGDIIESTYTHDFKSCSCGAVCVDGGKEYIRRCGKREDWEELSLFQSAEDMPNDLKELLDKGLNDVEASRELSIDDAFRLIDKKLQN